ncbi:MAG: STAS/SEC14 domain-containing protein [Bacteroidia bacterium]|nr:STAS/SEC14 domain-containing protein [Bacteroidia bacterium]
MMYQILDLPPNMIGFKAEWKVTKKDFEEVVIPCVEKHVEKMGQINYMLVLKTSVRDFTFFAWIKDVLMGLRHITKWNRAAIITDSKLIKFFTMIFSFLVPGEFKAFPHKEIKRAINWVSKGILI